MIPAGKVYKRNDYFEYHLFLLKREVEQRMSDSGFTITKTTGDETGILPSLDIEKLGIKISFDGKEGYCLEAQSQAEKFALPARQSGLFHKTTH